MGTSVLVAGASRGIGAAIATGFARDGTGRVVLVGRTEVDLERVAGEVRGHGARAEVIVADLTDVAAAPAAGSGAGAPAAGGGQARAHPPGALAPGPPGTLHPRLRPQRPAP